MTGYLSTHDVAARTGVTHRQLDYAYRNGVLWPQNGGGGSGTRLHWPMNEVAVIGRLAEVAQELAMDFGALASRHAATLRNGQAVKVTRVWGEFSILPPVLTVLELETEAFGQVKRITVAAQGDAFSVQCGWCGWETEMPHTFNSAYDIARGHNKGSHRQACVVVTPQSARQEAS